MQQQIKFETTKEPNQQQKECINFKTGIKLALAGPGTGKTFSISRRIKFLIENNVDPNKILCLTYTDTAANEMRNAVSKIINEATAQKINIFTYHSLCLNIIENNQEDFSEIAEENFKIIKEITKYKLLKECVDEINPTANRDKKNNPYANIKSILGDIAEIKKNIISKENFFNNLENHPEWGAKLFELENKKQENILKNKKNDSTEKKIAAQKEKIEKAKELWQIYELYNNKMKNLSLIDFEDMLTFVYDKFKENEDFTKKIASNYSQILVDEYQDTNKIQNEILFNLIDNMQEKNALVVGDDDQTIYTFQGAHINTIQKFIEKYSNTENFNVICLKENRRSTQNILNFGYEVSKCDPYRLEGNPDFIKFNINKNLSAKNESLLNKNKLPKFVEYITPEREINAIVQKIEEIINSNDCPKQNEEKKLNEIAILTKSNDELKIYAEKLKSKNIPFEIKEGKSIFEIKASITLYLYLKLLANPALYEENAFKLMLIEPFNFNKQDYTTLWELRHKKNNTLFIDEFKNTLKENAFIEPDKIENFIKTYENIYELMQNETLRTTILTACQKTGIYNYFVNCNINKTENILGLKKIIQEAYDFSQDNKDAALEDFINYLDFSRENNIKIQIEKPPITMNAVQLTTYHSSKGREFEYVFMPNLKRSKWESSSKSNTIKIPTDEVIDEDERKKLKKSNETKLMYVGITRAKHGLYLSYSQDLRLGLTEIIKPFLNLTENKKEEINEQLFENDILYELNQKDFDYKKEFRDLIKKILSEISYSPSSINTYLKCPRQYLYSYILKLDTKSDFKDELNYGTAMHYALQKACEYAIKNNEYPKKEDIINNFKQSFDNLILSDKFTRNFMQERAEKSIENFYPQLISTPADRLVENEYSIKDSFEGIKISIKIDRIEKNDDDTYTIADYKTGSEKKANDFQLGKKYENYLIQMVLYKIFFEKFTSKKVSGLKIIQPDNPNCSFYMDSDKETEENVKEIFTNAYKNINELNFEQKQSKDNCKKCPFKDLCAL